MHKFGKKLDQFHSQNQLAIDFIEKVGTGNKNELYIPKESNHVQLFSYMMLLVSLVKEKATNKDGSFDEDKTKEIIIVNPI